MAEAAPEVFEGPISVLIEHAKWGARVKASEEMAKVFREAEDEDSHDFNKYAPYLKKMVVDKNAVAQEKGIEAFLVYLDRAANAFRTGAPLAESLVEKGLGAAKQSTKKLTVEALLLLVELAEPNADSIVAALLAGTAKPQPKLANASIMVLREALKQFGPRVVTVKELLAKVLPKLFEHRDESCRSEAMALAIELGRWLGPQLLISKLKDELRPAQMKELETSLSSLPSTPAAVPTRFMRSQQQQQQQRGGAAVAIPATVDPLEFVEATDVLGGLKGEWFELLTSTKWKERTEALDSLLNTLSSALKIKNGDFAELTKCFKTIVAKDANVLVITKTLKAVGLLARGLRLDYGPYAKYLLPTLLEKFKEKKQTVVDALHEALDYIAGNPQTTKDKQPDGSPSLAPPTAVGGCISFVGDALEEVSNVVEKNPNPAAKAQSLVWVVRCLKSPRFSTSAGQTLGGKDKTGLKTLVAVFSKALDEALPETRDAAAEGFGALISLLGERALQGYLAKLDAIKVKKIKEFVVAIPTATTTTITTTATSSAPTPAPISASDLLDLTSSPPHKSSAKPKLTAPTTTAKQITSTALSSQSPSSSQPSTSTLKQNASVSKQSSSISKPAAAARSSSSSSSSSTGSKPSAPSSKSATAGKTSRGVQAVVVVEDLGQLMTPEDALAKAEEILPGSVIRGLTDKNWKERVAASEELGKLLVQQESTTNNNGMDGEILVRVVEPTFKDSNFQVLNNVIRLLAKHALQVSSPSVTFPKRASGFVIGSILSDKLADVKLKTAVSECLSAFAEVHSPGFVFSQLYKPALQHKNPKVVGDAVAWMCSTIEEFGIHGSVNVKSLIDNIKLCLESSNATVRTNSVTLLGVLRRFLGPDLRNFFVDTKSALMQIIDKEFSKVADQPAPPPTALKLVRGENPSSRAGGGGGGGGGLPREDVSGRLCGSKIVEGLKDKNWKIRKEALDSVEEVVNSVGKRIQPKFGVLISPSNNGGCLKDLFKDPHQNVAVQSLTLTGFLATSAGPGISSHVKAVMPAVFMALNDNKKALVQAAVQALDAWIEQTTLAPFLPILPQALSSFEASGGSGGRKELLVWLSKFFSSTTLTNAVSTCCSAGASTAVDVLKPLVKPTLLCLQDKSAEVRKPAEAILGELLSRLGYEVVRGQMKDIKPAVVLQIQPIIDKLRESISSSASRPKAIPTTTTTTPTTTTAVAAVATFTPQATPPTVLAIPSFGTTQQQGPPASSIPTPTGTTDAPSMKTGSGSGVASGSTVAVAIISWLEVLNSSSDDARVIEVLKAMTEKINSTSETTPTGGNTGDIPSQMISYADRIVYALGKQLCRGFGVTTSTTPTTTTITTTTCISSRFCKYTINGLLTVLNRASMAKVISFDTLQTLMKSVLHLMRDDRLVNNNNTSGDTSLNKDDSYALLKSLNTLIFKVLENCDKTTVFSILLRFLRVELLSEQQNHQHQTGNTNSATTTATGGQPTFVDFVTRCLLKLTKALKSFIDEMDLAAILRDIHLFLSVHPAGGSSSSGSSNKSTKPSAMTAEQQTRASLPMKTVKTILHELVKVKGDQITNFLSLIPSSSSSPPLILSYIQLMLKSQQSSSNTASYPSPSPSPSPVKPITQVPTKEETRMADILPLAITPTNSSQSPAVSAPVVSSSALPISASTVDANSYLERLRTLRDKCGLSGTAATATSVPTTSPTATTLIAPITPAATETIPKPSRSFTVEELRERLRAATQKGDVENINTNNNNNNNNPSLAVAATPSVDSLKRLDPLLTTAILSTTASTQAAAAPSTIATSNLDDLRERLARLKQQQQQQANTLPRG